MEIKDFLWQHSQNLGCLIFHFWSGATGQGLETANKQPRWRFHAEFGLVQAAMKEVDKISKSKLAYLILLFLPKLLFFQIWLTDSWLTDSFHHDSFTLQTMQLSWKRILQKSQE